MNRKLYSKKNTYQPEPETEDSMAGHVMPNQNSVIRMTMDKNPVGKIPLGRPRLGRGGKM